ncbi:hypothetical protein SERLA73DRAFT_150199 [Serpula lacrymans var. lacrymans S7.3]|uniref:Uncharacterized protein n=1 Tax=Serpula lacrymans var. lacrymans (strain S7.3) TaxID=936435 RepID=F8PLG7_SERL3|nr:hypothetical protein SERLA73DRAFT_150199 [Serpula lacrymans var. lacrymans S7.3]
MNAPKGFWQHNQRWGGAKQTRKSARPAQKLTQDGTDGKRRANPSLELSDELPIANDHISKIARVSDDCDLAISIVDLNSTNATLVPEEAVTKIPKTIPTTSAWQAAASLCSKPIETIMAMSSINSHPVNSSTILSKVSKAAKSELFRSKIKKAKLLAVLSTITPKNLYAKDWLNKNAGGLKSDFKAFFKDLPLQEWKVGLGRQIVVSDWADGCWCTDNPVRVQPLQRVTT